ncbi:hypothetical protein FQA39_LY12804 [Lamprigera yunnana]|nr:hypothetical protein FQA39_LY12804 [Lamprigera yunnana]
MPSIKVDGNDFFAVYGVMKEVCDYVRAGNGPVFVELDTYRLGAHSSSDQPDIYRPKEALDVAMERDKTVIVYGEDVGLEGGVFRATQGLQQKYGIERSFNAPISEAMFVGVAQGMAMNGMKPVVELQFEGLGLASLQNILTHVGRMRNRTRGKYTVPMVIRMPMGGGIRALEHHSEALEAIYAHIPGIKTVIPSTPYDTKGLILAAIESPDPVIVLEPTKLYRAFKQEVPDGFYTVPIGEGYKMMEGSDLTVVTYGAQTVECLKAVELLKQSHPNATIDLIDLREGLTEGKVTEVMVNLGDTVKAGDSLFHVETDKVNSEIPAPVAGKIAKINIKAEQEIKVGDVVMEIDDGSGAGVETPTEQPAKKVEAKKEAEEENASVVGSTPVSNEVIASRDTTSNTVANSNKGVKASPLARKVAADKGVDLTTVTPSGPNGRILVADLDNAKAGTASKVAKNSC